VPLWPATSRHHGLLSAAAAAPARACACYVPSVLTRSQVAKRLGKSVATVRRIEGVLLAPWQDARGIYRFDPVDVDRLVNDIARGDVALWEEMRADDGASRLVKSAERASSWRGDADQEETAARRRQSGAASEQIANLQRENRELLSFAQQLSRLLVETSSRSQLKALPRDVLELLVTLVDLH